MIYLNQKYTKLFLDTVDTVLNSNTFLLKTEVDFDSIEELKTDISNFIKSKDFTNQLLEQDVTRNWWNFQTFDSKGNHLSKCKTEFVKPNFEIQLDELDEEKALLYLRAMLTVEKNNYNFWSPYDKQINTDKAIDIVKNFIYEIVVDKQWKFFTLNTDFGYSKTEKRNKKTTMAYFEGDYGSDSASLIITEDKKAYLLLTNGID